MKAAALALVTLLSTVPTLALARSAPRLAVAGTAAPTLAPAAAPAPAAVAPAAEPYARFNRFAFSLMFGFGSVSLDKLHDLSRTTLSMSGLSGDAPESGLQINAEIAFRYYFPYYVMAQVGYSAVYNKASAKVSQGLASGTLYNDNLVMETPVLVGGYYPFFGRLYTYAAIGPSVFFYPRSWWDIDPGGAPDYKADPGVGFHFLTGADFLVTEFFAVGLELRYRHIKTSELKELKYGVAVPGYDLDLSGVSLGVLLRFYVI